MRKKKKKENLGKWAGIALLAGTYLVISGDGKRIGLDKAIEQVTQAVTLLSAGVNELKESATERVAETTEAVKVHSEGGQKETVTEETKKKEPSPTEKEDSTGGNYYDESIYDDKGEIVRVKDGDTYVVSVNEEDITVRLIGVDTPESVAPEEYYKENSEEGKEVSAIVKEKIKKGDTVFLEYDIEKCDKYGRSLAYVYFEDGKMVQEWLLENGYAQTMTIQPNSKYADLFASMQKEAMKAQKGLWADYE